MWAVALGTITATTCPAQEDASASGAPPPAPDPLWLISCSNSTDPDVLTCEFSQSIVLTREGQRLATASFARNAGEPVTIGVFTVPAGVHLPAGMTVSVDGTNLVAAPFLTCDARGCQAEAEVTPEALEALRGGMTMSILVERADRQPLSFDFDLNGFGETEALLP
jgi:invasion protein IalB